MTQTFSITTEVWLYPGKAAWHFVTIPPETTAEINDLFALQKRGWGSLPVLVTIGKTTWKTSIFPDKKTNSYLLPLKKEVRSNENISVGHQVQISLEISE